jgi:hypothetical protein
MNDSPRLPQDPVEPPATDFSSLRQEGIAQIQRLSGQLWTDYNSHDPGITILEQFCYALTDLAYRIRYNLPDLLTREGKDPNASLPTPGRILTTEPVTLADLRKLVIDLIGVKNAWIEMVSEPSIPVYYDPARDEVGVGLQANHVTATKIALKGLYRVLIEKSDAIDIDGRDIDGREIVRKVARLLHAHRGLGEDFEEIRVLDSLDIQVHARLEVAPVEDPPELLAIIYQKIAAYCSPAVPFYTLEQMLERGRRVDEIFESPVLQHGFIDSHELDQLKRRSALRVSDLIHELMGVPGVLAVQSIRLATGEKTEDWLLKLDTAEFETLTPRFDPRGSRIDLVRNQLPITGIKDAALAAFDRRERRLTRASGTASTDHDLRPPIGRDRNIGNYYSLQHHFPSVYGIGAAGLPESATPERKARARQLKGYLLFYDQLLANCSAQLAHAGQLFSYDSDSSQTYFSQAVEDPGLRLDELRKTGLDDHRPLPQKITDNPLLSLELESGLSGRHNRFLNHLLARFAEQLTDCSPANKRAFLRQYPRISSARATAMNYLESAAPDNLSGLEQRLRLKLGLHDQEEQFYLVEHILLRPMEEDNPAFSYSGQTLESGPLFGNVHTPDPYSLQISFVFPAWPERFQNPDFKQFTTQTIREETPAHLTCYVQWLNQADMRQFEAVYAAWLTDRRNYWKNRLGL